MSKTGKYLWELFQALRGTGMQKPTSVRWDSLSFQNQVITLKTVYWQWFLTRLTSELCPGLVWENAAFPSETILTA